MIALNYTPVIQKHTSVKRRGRGRQLEQRDNGEVANAFSHDPTMEPPAKKQKTSGPGLQLPHSRLTVTSNNSRNDPGDSRKSSRTANVCARVSAIPYTRKRREMIRKRHSLFNSIRQWRRRRRRRKQFASRLKKEGDGEIKESTSSLLMAS